MIGSNITDLSGNVSHYAAHKSYLISYQAEVWCHHMENLPWDESCIFVKDTISCAQQSKFIDYFVLFYCKIGFRRVWFIHTCLILIGAMYTICLILSAFYYAANIVHISSLFGLEEYTAGSVLLSLANVLPEFLCSLLGDLQMVINWQAKYIGTTLFESTVGIGCAAILKPCDISRRFYLRNMLFYMPITFYISIMFRRGFATWTEGVLILVVYVIYICYVSIEHYYLLFKVSEKFTTEIPQNTPNRRMTAQTMNLDYMPDIDDEFNTEILQNTRSRNMSAQTMNLHYMPHIDEFNTEIPQNTPNRRMTAQAMNLHYMPHIDDDFHTKWQFRHANKGLFKQFFTTLNPFQAEELKNYNAYQKMIIKIFFPVQIFVKLLVPTVNPKLPRYGWSKLLNCLHMITAPLILGIIITSLLDLEYYAILYMSSVGCFFAILIFFTSRTDRPPTYYSLFAFYGVLCSALITYFISEELFSVAYTIGVMFGLSKSLIGLTLQTWANSISDFALNFALLHDGFERMAIAGFQSSMLVRLVFSVSCRIIVNSLMWGKDTITVQNYSAVVTSQWFILIVICYTPIALGLTRFQLRRSIGAFLLAIYLLFIIHICLSNWEIIHGYGTGHGQGDDKYGANWA